MKITYALTAIALVIILLYWTGLRDTKLNEAMDIYTKCVEREYNTTPAYYFNQYGEYPECK